MQFLITIFLFFSIILPSYSLDIQESIKSTVTNNATIKIGLEEINESKELISSSLGNFKPDISISLTEKQSTTETTTATSTTTVNKLSDTYSLIIKQNIYNGGRNNLELEKSRVLFDKQIENFYITLNNLILQAIDGYLTVQVYEKSLDVTKKSYQVIQQIYKDTLTKQQLGTLTLVDLKNAESSYELAKSNLILAENNLDIGKKTFKRIVGLNALDLTNIVNIDTNIKYSQIVDLALIHNHELKLLKYDFEVAALQLEIIKNVKLPTLNLTGDLSYNDNVSSKGTESTSGSISANLSIPIFQKGIENSDIRKYQSQLLQAEYKIDDKKDEIKLSTNILSNNLNVYKSQLQSLFLSIEANEIALSVVQKEYDSGTRTFADLIDQEDKLLKSKLDYFNKNKELLVTYFEILSIEGLLLDSFKEYLPKIG